MKPSGVGGQAVLEGVMMKNKDKYAIAVRKPDKEIVVEVKEYQGIGEKVPFFKLPVIRGVVAFIESLVIGVKTITYSAEFYEEEPDKKDNTTSSDNKKSMPEGVATALTVILAIVLAVGIFMVLPYFISQLLRGVTQSQKVLTLIEGIIRILLFVGYISVISLMEDIKRVFMYHGAEHKVINCIENGYELTVKNARLQSKHHKRCGTSFALYVIFLSVIFFMFINVSSPVWRLVLRLLLVPVIAGVSYEFIKLAGRSDNKVVNILSKPGFWLQGLTTKEPDHTMLEVAIASVEAVFDWKEFQETNKTEIDEIKQTAKKQDADKNKLDVIQNDIAEEEFKGLDKVLTAAENEKEQLQESKQRADSVLSRRSASFDPAAAVTTEEDDEVLMALDKFFVLDQNDDEDRV